MGDQLGTALTGPPRVGTRVAAHQSKTYKVHPAGLLCSPALLGAPPSPEATGRLEKDMSVSRAGGLKSSAHVFHTITLGGCADLHLTEEETGSERLSD